MKCKIPSDKMNMLSHRWFFFFIFFISFTCRLLSVPDQVKRYKSKNDNKHLQDGFKKKKRETALDKFHKSERYVMSDNTKTRRSKRRERINQTDNSKIRTWKNFFLTQRKTRRGIRVVGWLNKPKIKTRSGWDVEFQACRNATVRGLFFFKLSSSLRNNR